MAQAQTLGLTKIGIRESVPTMAVVLFILVMFGLPLGLFALLWWFRWRLAWPLGLASAGLSAPAWLTAPEPVPGPNYWDVMFLLLWLQLLGGASAASLLLRGGWLWWQARSSAHPIGN